MLRHYQDYLRAKCEVVSIGGIYVYPIFRVGYTSLMADADMVFTNKEITKCNHITVMLRNPAHRFVSGVNEYGLQNGKIVDDVYDEIKKGTLVDRHFMPQYLWLLHLYKYYKGPVELKPFENINEITQTHLRKNEPHQQVEPVDRFIEVDLDLMQDMNKTLLLGDIIRKHKNVLS